MYISFKKQLNHLYIYQCKNPLFINLIFIRLGIFIVFSHTLLLAQVSINTRDSKAVLDIEANIAPSNIDDTLIPRLAEFPTGMTEDQNAMLAFLTGDGTTMKSFFQLNMGDFQRIYVYNTKPGITIDATITKTVLEVERIR